MQDGSVDVRWDFGGMPKFAQSTARYAVGISHVRGENVIRAALIRVLGRGHQMVCDPIRGAYAALPDEAIGMLARNTEELKFSPSDFSFWQADLADRCAQLANPLIGRARHDFVEPLVVAVDGIAIAPTQSQDTPRSISLCDSGCLAASTGITVVDDFSAADVVHGGSGGPVMGMADWILFGDRSGIPGQRNRGVLRLGPSVRVSIVPSRGTRADPPEIVCIDGGPGYELLGRVRDTVLGGNAFDSKLAVQANVVHSIVDEWCNRLSDFRRSRSTSEDHSEDHSQVVETLVADLERRQDQSSITPAQWMMTATEFLARLVADAVHDCTPKSMPIFELVLTGEMHLDGLLQNRLGRFLPGITIRSGAMTESTCSTDAVAIAVMGLLRIDNAIGNSTRQTGTAKPRSLGRLTPGRPSNWNRVLLEMATAMRESMTLKTAV